VKRQIEISCTGADLVEIGKLENFQGNLKKLSKDNLAKLKKEILQNGFSEPISVWKNEDKFYILNGHQRVRTLLHMAEDHEIPKIPINYVDAKNIKEAKRKVLALTSQYGEMTNEGLFQFMNDSSIEWSEIKDSFRFPEIDFNHFEKEKFSPAIIEDEAPEPPQNPVSKLGDWWGLGDNLLYCGDCSDVGGFETDLLFTDPPYGVSYADKNEFLNSIDKGNGNQSKIENDHKSKEEMAIFWAEKFTKIRILLKNGASYYITGPQGGDLLLLLESIRDAGFPLRHMLVWAKNNHVLGRSDYHYKHEPIIYGWLGTHKFYGGRGENSLWQIDKPQKAKEHPTMKPVALYARGIGNSSKEGDWVLDPFAGSGTCMIASQQLGRRNLSIELEPKYCDVIIERWQNLTGGKAVKKTS
jgi:DNA modification methylase